MRIISPYHLYSAASCTPLHVHNCDSQGVNRDTLVMNCICDHKYIGLDITICLVCEHKGLQHTYILHTCVSVLKFMLPILQKLINIQLCTFSLGYYGSLFSGHDKSTPSRAPTLMHLGAFIHKRSHISKTKEATDKRHTLLESASLSALYVW